MKGQLETAVSAVWGSWLPIMLEPGAGGKDVAGQVGWRMREAEDCRLSLSLALWFPRYSRQAPRFPCSRQAGGVRSHLESPGKSMGEAADPGSPWGIPGCSLGWGGSGGAGSEGQPLPWGSALHGLPTAPGSPRAEALGRERAPPAGRPERVSSRCRRPRSVYHPRPDWHLPGAPGLQWPKFSHGPSFWGLCP